MDLQNVYSNLKQQAQKSSDYVLQELRQIRTGQVTPALVEDIEVNAYGGQSLMKLRELSSIATEGPSTLVITPFDVSVIQDIERAILASPLQLSPRVDGRLIRVSAPSLTEEQREKFVRLANEKVEEGKVQIRWHRDEARKHVKQLLDEKSITEDDKFRSEKEIDSITKDFTDKLDELKKRKQDEIMNVG